MDTSPAVLPLRFVSAVLNGIRCGGMCQKDEPEIGLFKEE